MASRPCKLSGGNSPDILLIDPNMPRKDGWAVLRELQQEGRLTQVVILTETLNEENALEAIHLGVHGVMLKDMPLHLLIQCLRKVHAGEKWLEKSSISRVLDRMLQHQEGLRQVAEVLTPREIELVHLVTSGLDNGQIAKQLYISEGTVKAHLHHIYAKLEVKNRVELTFSPIRARWMGCTAKPRSGK